MCWFGPQKIPRSPMTYNGELIFKEPEYRKPRRTVHSDELKKSASAAETARCGSQHSGMKIEERFRYAEEERSAKQHASTLRNASAGQSSLAGDEVHFENLTEQDVNSGARGVSNNMPPRDPLCHTSNVTPPCPIKPVQRKTPTALQLYTHVSCYNILVGGSLRSVLVCMKKV